MRLVSHRGTYTYTFTYMYMYMYMCILCIQLHCTLHIVCVGYIIAQLYKMYEQCYAHPVHMPGDSVHGSTSPILCVCAREVISQLAVSEQ